MTIRFAFRCHASELIVLDDKVVVNTYLPEPDQAIGENPDCHFLHSTDILTFFEINCISSTSSNCNKPGELTLYISGQKPITFTGWKNIYPDTEIDQAVDFISAQVTAQEAEKVNTHLQKLSDFKKQGLLTESEFTQAQTRLQTKPSVHFI